MTISPSVVRNSLRAFAVLMVFAFAPGLRAQSSTIVQTKPFSFAIDGTVTGSGLQTYYITPANAFTASITPFDSSLGTLESFTVDWDLTVTGTIYTSTGMQIGVGNVSSGNFSVAGTAYYGLGNGGGGAKTATFTVHTTPPHDTFLVSTANPAILGAVTGASDYEVSWDIRPDLGIQNSIDGESYNASAVGSVSVTYTYAAVPEPSTAALLAGAATLIGALVFRRRALA